MVTRLSKYETKIDTATTPFFVPRLGLSDDIRDDRNDVKTTLRLSTLGF